MKKIFLTACVACSACFATAQNVIEMAPVTCEAGVALDDSEITLDFSYEGDAECCAVEFDLYIPEGLTLGDDDALLFEEGAGIPISKKKPVHTIEMVTKANDIAGYTHYYVLIYDTKKTAFIDKPLFSVYLDTSEATPGVYPILLKTVNVGGVDAADNATTDYITSYVKVGEPSNQTLAVKGCVTSLVNEALANEASISTLNLAEVTRINGDFTYVAGRNVVAPATNVNANVKFKAPLAGTYGSFCAPVDVNVNCYAYSKVQDGWAIFTPATTAPANTPVLISEAVKTDAQAAVLKTVEGRQITAGYYVAADGSGMRSVNSTATIPALRGAWEDIVASSNLRIAIETPTGIQYIGTADEVFGNTYDLQGRQVQEAHNGVFVVNGKKQFVK